MADRAGKRDKRVVAILGAGPSGLAAAMALTEGEAAGRYDVVVYQMGWRAGGKSSTGRNAAEGGRVEQNGSHYLFGCYHNTFALVRRAYRELEAKNARCRVDDPARVTDFGRFEDQFTPSDLIVSFGRSGGESHEVDARDDDGDWLRWFFFAPPNLSRPGEGGKLGTPFDFAFMLVQLVVTFAFELVLCVVPSGGRHPGRIAHALFAVDPFRSSRWFRRARSAFWRLVLALPAWLVNRVLARIARGVFVALDRLAQMLLGVVVYRRLGEGLCGLALGAARLARGVGRVAFFFGPRRARAVWELVASMGVGFLEDRLWQPGALESIDRHDFRQWLTLRGCRPEAVHCPLVKIWYDAVVAYERGERGRPSISAGVTVHALFKAVFAYKGNVAYQMRHEIGDAWVGPIVQTLMDRGVTFHFFHRVRDLVPGADGRSIERVMVEPQLPAGVVHDAVFDERQGRRVWPGSPLVTGTDGETLADAESFYGEQTRPAIPLRAGRDFDHLICALPGAVLPADARSAFEASGAWRDMDDHVRYMDSISYRAWFARDLSELGWAGPPPILSGFAYPLSTWEDNSQNLGHEGFEGDPPKAIGTVFGPLECPEKPPLDREEGLRYLDRQAGRVRSAVQRFLERDAKKLWPGIEDGQGNLDPDAFFHPRGVRGQPRIDWQLSRANAGPNERYVLALPNTLRYRLRPEESGYDNLLFAGEWTRNGFEVGCLEGAVNSGLVAARAISGYPKRIVGEHDFDFGLLHRLGETSG